MNRRRPPQGAVFPTPQKYDPLKPRRVSGPAVLGKTRVLDEHKSKLESILKKQQKDADAGKSKLREKEQKRREALDAFEKKKAAEIKPALEELIEVFRGHGRREVHLTEENDRLPNFRPKFPPSVTIHLVSRAQAAENPQSLRFSLRFDADTLTMTVWASNRKRVTQRASAPLDAVTAKWIQEEFVKYVESTIDQGR
jgi:hypothetical protein